MIPIIPLALAAGAVSVSADAEQSLSALLWQVGACVVERRYSDAKRYVLQYPGRPEMKAADLPTVAQCNDIFLRGNVQVTFRQLEYRYALARALVRRDFRDVGPMAISADLTLPMPQELMKPVTDRQKQVPAVFRAEQLYARIEARDALFSDCLVRAQPEVIRSWLVTAPASDAERAAGSSIGPLIDLCNVQLGQKRIGFSAETMRGPVALAYLRLATAMRDGLKARP